MTCKLLPAISIISLCLTFNVFALDKMSCVDLEASANDLDDIANGFYAASNTIRENDSVDLMLRDLIDALHLVAASEMEGDLSLNVNRLERAWQDMNADTFANALEGTINSFDRLLERDCY